MKYPVTKGSRLLFHKGVINNSLEAFDIFFFKNVSSEVYERPSLGYQATNEIVQNPVQEESYPPKLFYMWTLYLFDHTYSNFFVDL